MRLAYVLLVAAGCAAGSMQRVPDADWRAISPAERDAIDKRNADETARAQKEVQLATASLEEAKRAAAAKPGARPTAGGHDERDQLARVEGAKAEYTRANLAWREDRLAAAFAQLEVVTADREVRRAEVIDRNMRGGDSYDVTAYRGQLARAQERYAAATDRAARSRAVLVHASADLASQKEAFAQLVRGSTESPSHQMQLSGWTGELTAGSHRRGLKIVSASATYLKRPDL